MVQARPSSIRCNHFRPFCGLNPFRQKHTQNQSWALAISITGGQGSCSGNPEHTHFELRISGSVGKMAVVAECRNPQNSIHCYQSKGGCPTMSTFGRIAASAQRTFHPRLEVQVLQAQSNPIGANRRSRAELAKLLVLWGKEGQPDVRIFL